MFIPLENEIVKRPYSSSFESPKIVYENGTYILSHPDKTCEIYYTLNNTIPSMGSNKYTQAVEPIHTDLSNHLNQITLSPIHAKPATFALPESAPVLRAVAYFKNRAYSKPVMKTLVQPELLGGLRIVSLSVDEEEWFNPMSGIFVQGEAYWNTPQKVNTPWWERESNYSEKGHESRRRVGIELIDSSGKQLMNTNVFMRIHGNATRGFPQKSLRIEVDDYYGEVSLEPIFDDNHRVESFNLRCSGNDWGKTYLADAFMSSVALDLGLIAQRAEPVHVLINGVYWGLYNIRDRFDESYFNERFNCYKASLIEMHDDLKFGSKKDVKAFKELHHILLNGSIEEKEVAVLEQVKLDEFYKYIIVQTYFANTDWPNNNLKAFRKSRKSKWQWLVYDLDYGLGFTGLESSINSNMFAHIKKGNSIVSEVFKVIISTPLLKADFIAAYEKALTKELSPEVLVMKLDRMQQQIGSAIELQIARWRKPSSFAGWKLEIQRAKTFLNRRNDVISKQLHQL